MDDITQKEKNQTLLRAVEYKKLDIVKKALALGANPNTEHNFKRETIFITACKHSNAEVIRCLIKAGADVNARERSGYTPIIYAAMRGDINIITMLICAKADVNSINNFGDTPLMCAALRGNTESMEVLMQAGADISIRDMVRNLTALNILKKMHPDKHKLFINKRILVQEDTSEISDSQHEPDFGI